MKQLSILLFCVLLTSCAREISSDKLVERDGIFYEINSTEPYSGSVYTEYENLGRGQLKIKGSYKDGEKDGLWEEYYENGQLEIKSSYKDGKLGSVVSDCG